MITYQDIWGKEVSNYKRHQVAAKLNEGVRYILRHLNEQPWYWMGFKANTDIETKSRIERYIVDNIKQNYCDCEFENIRTAGGYSIRVRPIK